MASTAARHAPTSTATTKVDDDDDNVRSAPSSSSSSSSSTQPLRVQLFVRLPIHLRLDVWPFAVVYAGLVGLAKRSASDAFETGLIVGFGFMLHALAALSTQWSVGTKRGGPRKTGRGLVPSFVSSPPLFVLVFVFFRVPFLSIVY